MLKSILFLAILPMLIIPAFAELEIFVEDGLDIPSVGKTIIIKITGAVDTVIFIITSEFDEIIDTFSFVASDQGEISLPWLIPKDMPFGNYIINATDSFNSAEVIYVYEELIEPIPITLEETFELATNNKNALNIHNSTLSIHDIMIYSHDTMVNEHSQNFILHNDKIDSLLLLISSLQQEVKGLKELVQGEAPIPDDTPVPVIDNFIATPTGSGTVTISWIITDGQPITLYNLIHRPSVGAWTTEDVSVNATSYVISGLTSVEYDFKFSAENAFGESKIERFLITP